MVIIIKDRRSIRQIGFLLANAVNMKTKPAWFGYHGFDPRLPGLMSTGSEDAKVRSDPRAGMW